MTHAMLFYRTLTSKKTTTPNPPDLPTAQKLLFTPPADLTAKFDEDYTNNIVRKIPIQPFSRRIIQSDQGVVAWLMTIEGNYQTADSGSTTKLHLMRKKQQGDDYHTFGAFGLWYPQGPAYVQDDLSNGCATGLSIDPDNTHGLMIENIRGSHIGVTKELVDFGCRVSYGGDL
jgi:hypothetical protein